MTRRKSYLTTPAGIASIVVVVGALLLVGVRVVGALAGPGNDEAVAHCQSEARTRTQAPSRVVFADGPKVERSGEAYGVSGALEMPNGYGAMIRGTYQCWLQPADNGRWVTTSAVVSPR